MYKYDLVVKKLFVKRIRIYEILMPMWYFLMSNIFYYPLVNCSRHSFMRITASFRSYSEAAYESLIQ